MIDSAARPTDEHLAAMRRAREAELIVRFCEGKVLAAVEMAEIGHILPVEVMANPPAHVLVKPAQAYAAELGTTHRTIYRWLDIGRKNRDPVPLDEPAQMLGWWARNMSHKVPDYLNDWVSRVRSTVIATVQGASNVASAGAGAAGEKGRAAQPDRAAIDMTSLAGHGLEAAVQVLRQNVEATSKLLATAFNDPNDQRLAHNQSRFEAAVDQLRKAEGSLLALHKSRGDLAPRSEFRSDLVTLMIGLRGMCRRRADNICSLMADKLLPEQLGTLRAALVAEGQRDEKLLRTSRFWQVGPDGELKLPAA